MIKLYQFPRIKPLPNLSPFCVKVETFLRINQLEYENRFVMNPAKSPRGKLPFIKIDEETICDSALIIETLKKRYQLILDDDLTEEQLALSTTVESMLNDTLYWVLLYFRWQDKEGWQLTEKIMFSKAPWFVKTFIVNRVRKNMILSLYHQGLGRFDKEEISALGIKLIKSLAVFLGDNPFFFGTKVHTIDASLFGFLINILWFPSDKKIQQEVASHPNLLRYCQTLWARYYADIPYPSQYLPSD